MPKRKKAPESLREHLVDTLRQEFLSFDRREFWKDLLGGCALAVLAVLIGFYYDLSIKPDWEEHPFATVSVLLLPLSVLIIEVLTRCWKALRRIYRERTHASFRDDVHGVLGIMAGACVFFAITAYPIYQSYPHPRLTLPSGEWEIAKVPPVISFGHATSTYILFHDIVLTNAGTDTPIGEWWIDVRTIGGVNFRGPMNYIDPRDEFGLPGFIFTKLANTPLKHGQTVHGAASFVITGTAPGAIEAPGTRFRIHFFYANGCVYTLELITRSS